ncbi:S8 family serine peptidase [Shewanella sp. A32]|uniref:S8 family serine peptidase n=1 Tax=Shewanella sp. A32 TaxID=3031327 RepID=UPI0023B8B1FD|nr:S8 family serine peptidase [Shewanella sp. A32]MDF0534789.1 S8 family serine peptidase [Shewanella sp. A32]
MRALYQLLATVIALPLCSGVFAADNGRYIVKFKEGKGPAVAAMLKSQGAKLELDLAKHNAAAFTLPAQALAGLSHNPNVEYVEPDVKRYPMSQTVPYGIPMVQADQVSDSQAGNMKVCIIDSGYDYYHEDLSDNMVDGIGSSETGDWRTDELHHGTHVAGTIAAVNNDRGVIGINPNKNLNLYIVKVFNGDGVFYSSGLVAALDDCEAVGAKVINMSLGGSFKSRFEDSAFAAAEASGILSVAAAGNDGNSRNSYPASYSSVISVAAVDEDKQHADFSQYNSAVELAAPGVSVLSTVPTGTALVASATVAGHDYAALGMDGSPTGNASGLLMDCGTGESQCDAAGKICLIQRGNITFAEKVLACEAGGGVGAIIYNNTTGMLNGTLSDTVTSIPSVGVTADAGAAMLANVGDSANVTISYGDYAYYDGTSMATPHVAGVAALVWSNFPQCTNKELRTVLQVTAEDLGTAGRDNYTGFGLVQAKAAYDYIATYGCAGSSNSGGGNSGGGKTCKGKNCQ